MADAADAKMTARHAFSCRAHEGDVASGESFETTEGRALYLNAKGFATYDEDRPTLDDLKDRAAELEIEGRSKMNRDALALAVADALK